MKTYPTLILLCVVVVYRGCGAVEKIRTTSSDLPDDDTPFPDFPTTPSTTTTTDFFSTNPTTISTTTTTDFFPTSPTTTTTTPSTTTTDSTTTSTTVPTTTTTPTTTTVPSTTPTTPTTTGAPTTTTPAPNHPNPSTWMVVEEGTNVTCLVIKLSATFIVPYTTRSGKVVNSTLSLSPNATANGTCGVGTTEQAISLKWFAETEFFNQNMMTVFFKKNTTSVNEVSYFISDITLDVYPDSKTFPDSLNDSYIRSGMGVNESLFSVRVNSSYRCNAQEQLKLDIDGQLENSFVSLSNFQVEAFRTQTNDKFNSAVDCAADRIITSDIVPIAVGCALAALVVIVLVAYLIGRRRARQRGYQSV